jgi:death-on-curing protein
VNEQLDLADFLVIAEHVLGVDAKALKLAAKLNAAESALAAPFMGFGDTLFYSDPAQRAAIVCSRIIRNHPLPDGNKRTGYLCMRMQLEAAGLMFDHPDGDQDKTADVIEALAASTMPEEDFVEWVKARTSDSSDDER